MDLMTASTSFSLLKKKYRDFGAPTVRIRVDGTEITEKLGARLSDIAVELTSEFSASGCSFDVIGLYQAEQTDFSDSGPARLLQLGAKVELELGYIETVNVFFGLITELEFVFDNENAPYIHVECMDAKCLLMKQQRLALITGKSVTEAIGEMLDEQPFKTYIMKKNVESPGDKVKMIPAAMESDFQLVARYAAYIGYEFFILQGNVYLRKTPASASPVLSLSPQGGGLQAFKLSLRGDGLYRKTRVVGINPEDDKMVSGEATASGTFGKGRSAAQMMGESVKTYYDHKIESADAAGARAKTLMQSAQGGFGRIECRCIGLPELVPGRNVTIRNISGNADREYYILNVRHTFDECGFFTTVEARVNSL